ncbi:hypothetical protein RJ639_041560 [Escallonia herrerae]|uniref:Uncharacterized protein n=1 Tax=Escallonia herrerae TaxID=1293975 RepID=A0AA88WEM2_9ASTE|nr:hypothetical protein RJ639_041560 [Escallonia herrerae]
MSSAVKMLEGKIPVQPPLIKRGSVNEDLRFKAFEGSAGNSGAYFSTSSQNSQVLRSSSIAHPWIDSSASTASKNEAPEHSPNRQLPLDRL